MILFILPICIFNRPGINWTLEHFYEKYRGVYFNSLIDLDKLMFEPRSEPCPKLISKLVRFLDQTTRGLLYRSSVHRIQTVEDG